MTPGAPGVIFRTDASSRVGMGHVMRCMALWHAWHARGGRGAFAVHAPEPAVAAFIARQGATLIELEHEPGSEGDGAALLEAATRYDAGAVVIDGYQFDLGFQERIASALPVCVIDDLGNAAAGARLVVNQNAIASAGLYAAPGVAHRPGRLLLGPRYAMLRPEFVARREWRRDWGRPHDSGTRVLVTLGGSDPAGVTSRVVDALWPNDAGMTLRVIVGPAYAGGLVEPGPGMEVLCAPPDMAEHMAWSDIAVSAAGSSCWELLFMQVASILVIVADNQEGNARLLHEQGAVITLGRHDALTAGGLREAVASLGRDADRRETLGLRGRQLVDGGGAARVADGLAMLCGQ